MATALVLPTDLSLLQMNNASFVSRGNCPFDARPAATLPGDKSQKSYTTSSGLNCLDGGSPHDAECWAELELDAWIAEWFKITPQCPPRAASQFACNKRDPPEPWTTTFMRIAMGGGAWNGCSEIRNSNCQYNPYPCLGEGDTDLTKARYKYVAYTISQLHQFFFTWSALMDDTMNQAADSISGMISLVDPIKKQNTRLRLFLNILTFGLGILNGLSSGLTTVQTTIFTTVIDAIGKAPVVHDQLWPKGSAESQDIQIDKLTDQLQGPNGIHTTILENLERTLQVVQGTNQTDVSTFLAFASGGHFSIDSTQSAFAELGPTVRKGLLQIITTYLVSEALDKNEWHALIVPGANPLTLDQGTGLCPKWAEGTDKYQCDWWDGSTKWFACESLDDHGMCENYWWYSETHNSAYALVKKGKSGPEKQGGDFLREIFDKGWSTGPMLFENAAICEFSNLISQSAGSISYTSDYNSVAGFFYQGPPFTGYHSVNETTNFVSIPGGDTGNAFVAATWDENSLSKMVHPDTIFDNGGPEWGSRCVSQLNTTVANSWDPKGGHWTENNPES
ncbi:MAG: hypothetical protein Q9208_001187 [Pyrenodesmia sp. 3 TL-2023]